MVDKPSDIVHWGSPDDFDVQNQDITSWMTAYVDTLQPRSRRKQDRKIIPFRLIVHCYSRSTEYTYEAQEIASDMLDILEHSCIDITKPDDSVVIGKAILYEGRVTNETGKFGEQDKDIQLGMVVIDGHATEC